LIGIRIDFQLNGIKEARPSDIENKNSISSNKVKFSS
jgi:flagellar basal body L-ring protein FlgH